MVYSSSADWQRFDVTSSLLPGKELVGFRVFGYAGGDPSRTFLDDAVLSTEAPPCPASPDAGCEAASPGKSSVVLKDNTPDSNDSAAWKWAGPAPSLTDFGDPLNTSNYAFCVYQNGALALTATAPAGGTCADGKPCWKATDSGFKYVDKELTPDGLSTVVLKTGAKGGKLVVKGKGVNLALPALGLALPVTVELRRSDGAPCWSAMFSTAKENDSAALKAKSD